MNPKSVIISLLLSYLALYPAVYASDSSEPVFVAVRANTGAKHAIKKWGPTLDYLSQTLPAYKFVMIPYTSLRQQLADAQKNKFHFVLTNPATYVELEVSNHARAMLTLINNRRNTAQTTFGSVIFTHIDNTDILSLRDLKGKDFMAVNRLGFGGWRVGLKVLIDQGINPEKDFASLNFAGKQQAAVKAVLEKKVHAGMVRTDMLERLADKGRVNLRNVRILNQQHSKDFPFFHSTPLYPEWPFAVMPHTPTPLADQVKQALLKIDKNHPAAKAGMYMGWTEALDYKPVRQLLADIGVAPFSKNKPDVLSIYFLLGIAILLIAFYVLNRYIRK